MIILPKKLTFKQLDINNYENSRFGINCDNKKITKK